MIGNCPATDCTLSVDCGPLVCAVIASWYRIDQRRVCRIVFLACCESWSHPDQIYQRSSYSMSKKKFKRKVSKLHVV